MIKGFKIRLIPTKEQIEIFNKCFGLNRFIYNYCVDKQSKNYEQGNKFINKYELKKETIRLKETNEWMKELPAKIIHQATFDCDKAFQSFFKKKAKYPNFKSKRDKHQSFWNPPDAIKFTNSSVQLQKIGKVKLLERKRIPINVKYVNPIVSFDGLNYYISVGVEVEENQNTSSKTEGIGIDLGIKTLFTVSNGMVNDRPKKRVKKVEKKLKRLQRKASRLYIKYKGKDKSKNLLKLEREISKLYSRKTNILQDNIHKFTTQLIQLNPQFIAYEDLNVSGMMKNRNLAKHIADCKFYEIRRQIEYKCEWNNVDTKLVNRWFPSSKTCHECGTIHKHLTLKDRILKCECGNIVDRDYNASLNIRDYK